MLYVTYEEAVATMERALVRFMPADKAHHFAEIFAGNSVDGVHSHGMNRFPRDIGDIESGLCDPTVTEAERVSGFGGLEVWDAHFGVGPLIAEQAAERAAAERREAEERRQALKAKMEELLAQQPEFLTTQAYMAYFDDMYAFSPTRIPR